MHRTHLILGSLLCWTALTDFAHAQGTPPKKKETHGTLREMKNRRTVDARIEKVLPQIEKWRALVMPKAKGSISVDDVYEFMVAEERAITDALHNRLYRNNEAYSNPNVVWKTGVDWAAGSTDPDWVGGCKNFADQAYNAAIQVNPRFHTIWWQQRSTDARYHHVVLITNDVVGTEWVWDGWTAVGGWTGAKPKKDWNYLNAIYSPWKFYSDYPTFQEIQGFSESQFFKKQLMAFEKKQGKEPIPTFYYKTKYLNQVDIVDGTPVVTPD